MQRSRLSAHNLRIHTAACPKMPYFPMDRIHEARPNDIVNGDLPTPVEHLGFSYDGLSPQDIDMKARRKASMDTLKLYSGNLASLSTPMNRVVAKQNRKPAKAMAVAWGDFETLDARELASELSGDTQAEDAMSVGSLRPSSDTLSVSREKFISSTQDRKEQGTRNWRRLRMRRRNTVDKTKAMRRTHKATPPAQTWWH